MKDYAAALKQVREEAYDQQWDVTGALRENLRQIKDASPEGSHHQALREAATRTIDEIREARDIAADPGRTPLREIEYSSEELAKVPWNTSDGKTIRKPANELTKSEIAAEARELHAQFEQLSKRFEQGPAGERAEIREEMVPLVNRERELRQEFKGRIHPELNTDRAPEQQIAFGR
jgi:hypothetical protein